ncbi:hypothetical protein I6A60_40845 [Frankia sp. AgB1.9]|uniref:hypothetical protein n=1 Tax=unclassified Frankia TaxID=2632575 RepID=UPI0019334712|nr:MULTISPECIES: hypothetical protein [unclassified Frankia]MBL7491602.1 hypothetical protein [Frankia sp. AgW1.1]MBL7554127.1 hypothetical protein [Frankia sp. AgB1.9]MBL7618459.1 hypothetical protein [Frankia sp. AgB1.8]
MPEDSSAGGDQSRARSLPPDAADSLLSLKPEGLSNEAAGQLCAHLLREWLRLLCDQVGCPSGDLPRFTSSRPGGGEDLKPWIQRLKDLKQVQTPSAASAPVTRPGRAQGRDLLSAVPLAVEGCLARLWEGTTLLTGPPPPADFLDALAMLTSVTARYTIPAALEWDLTLARSYLHAVSYTSACMASGRGFTRDGMGVRDLEAEVTRSLAELGRLAGCEPAGGLVAATLLDGSLGRLKLYLDGIVASRPMFEPRSAFAQIGLRDLPDLAARTDYAIDMYGDENLSRLFEQGFAQLWATLGASVIGSERGDEDADTAVIFYLLRAEAYSFLAVAKSTPGRYSFPTRDRRALTEYLGCVRNGPPELEPRFVLICGPTPTGTLTLKLEILSTDLKIPIRYCTATALASLRDEISGTVDPELLLETVRLPGAILTDEKTKGLIKAIRLDQTDHADSVRVASRRRQRFLY